MEIKFALFIQELEEEFWLPKGSLTGFKRNQYVSSARHIAMHICRHTFGLSYQHIGSLFNKDHTSVIYGCKCVDDKLKDSDYVMRYNELLSNLLRKDYDNERCMVERTR